MFKNKKEIIIGAGTILIAGALVWIFQLDGLNTIKDFFKRPSIEVRSTSRPFAQEYFSTEMLTLSLRNVESERVYWIVDDREGIPASVQVQYAFLQDTNRAYIAAGDHRVVAVYQHGDSYKAVSRRVRVENSRLSAAARFQDLQFSLTAPEQFGSGWKLVSARLSRYMKGAFFPQASLATSFGEKEYFGAETMVNWIVPAEASIKFRSGLTNGSEPWVEYEFTKPGSDSLILVMPVEEKK
jgi:hypothetical protein